MVGTTLALAGLAMGIGASVAGGAVKAGGARGRRARGEAFVNNLRSSQPYLDPNAYVLPTEQTDYWDKMGQDAQNIWQLRQGHTYINTENQNEWRQNQLQLMHDLQARARGEVPSAAELTLRNAQQANIAAARGAAVSAEGVSPAMALRAQMGGQTSANIAASQQAGIMRAQEQAAAEGRLSQLLAGARTQDIGLAQQQAMLDQQEKSANLRAGISQRQMNNEMTKYYMNQGFSRDKAQMAANMAQQELIQQTYLSREGIAASVFNSYNTNTAGAAASGLAGFGKSMSQMAMMGLMNSGKK